MVKEKNLRKLGQKYLKRGRPLSASLEPWAFSS